jgi:hypothetical protein
VERSSSVLPEIKSYRPFLKPARLLGGFFLLFLVILRLAFRLAQLVVRQEKWAILAASRHQQTTSQYNSQQEGGGST